MSVQSFRISKILLRRGLWGISQKPQHAFYLYYPYSRSCCIKYTTIFLYSDKGVTCSSELSSNPLRIWFSGDPEVCLYERKLKDWFHTQWLSVKQHRRVHIQHTAPGLHAGIWKPPDCSFKVPFLLCNSHSCFCHRSPSRLSSLRLWGFIDLLHVRLPADMMKTPR